MLQVEIIKTGDGSHSLYLPALNETYHSRHGAIQESKHVFIKHGLEKFAESNAERISVLEIGFGTGLNALLTWEWATHHQREIYVTSVEPQPIPREIWSQLNYADDLNLHTQFTMLHEAAWELPQTLSPFFSIQKIKATIQEVNLSSGFDLVFFDAFAPDKQPDLWRPSVFQKVRDVMHTGSLLVTYCAKGQVKRDLKSVGFSLEKLAGPPGKREMIRANVT